MIGQSFIDKLGKPDPADELGSAFKAVPSAGIFRDVGSGFFLGQFLYLFGKGLEGLSGCLDGWQLPSEKERLILGRNAYGALLVGDGLFEGPGLIHTLDPVTGEHWSEKGATLESLFDSYLPKQMLPGFHDEDRYGHWMWHGRQEYNLDEFVIIEVPLQMLGTKMPFDYKKGNMLDYHRRAKKR